MTSQTFLTPYVEELKAVNPALAVAIYSSPIVAGLASDLI
jgi:hypothetical protein